MLAVRKAVLSPLVLFLPPKTASFYAKNEDAACLFFSPCFNYLPRTIFVREASVV